jgi:hypothetical protein
MTEFISEWDINRPFLDLDLPLISSGTYDFDIDWGDGTKEHYNSHICKHHYPYEGLFTIKIKGIIKGWKIVEFHSPLRDIKQWGCLKLGNEGGYFQRCKNLVISATDSPDLSETTRLDEMFQWCSNFNSPIGHWDVSGITSMKSMFAWCDDFDQDISGWNTDSVVSYDCIFFCCGIDLDHVPIKLRPHYRYRNTKPNKFIQWGQKAYVPMACCICLVDINKEDWRATRCTGSTPEHYHAFDKDCITHWMKDHNTCPVCRETI